MTVGLGEGERLVFGRPPSPEECFMAAPEWNTSLFMGEMVRCPSSCMVKN